MRKTPEFIKLLKKKEIFVFGSNLGGFHGAGAAYDAREKFGAQLGVGVGFTGRSYAIPTKDSNLRTLPLEEIAKYVDKFLEETKEHPDKKFLVTKIGTGLAGYSSAEIAPLFKGAIDLENVYLPSEFIVIIKTN
jgi:hypothetical protein